MKTKFSTTEDYKGCYLKEYEFFDGDHFVTFNLLEVNLEKQEVTLAVSNQGRIIVSTYDLMQSKNGRLFYFEYGVDYDLIFLHDFRRVAEVAI